MRARLCLSLPLRTLALPLALLAACSRAGGGGEGAPRGSADAWTDEPHASPAGGPAGGPLGGEPTVALPPAAPPGPKTEGEGEGEGEEGSEKPFEGTAGITEKKRPTVKRGRLEAARTGAHDRYDRVVFEFEGAVPGYHVEYVDKPLRQCGSGHVKEVAGDGWLRVRFEPSSAHTEEGKPTVKDRERKLKMENLVELDLLCDFEGQVEWVLGVRSPTKYRVLELSGPPRLVVDVLHPDR